MKIGSSTLTMSADAAQDQLLQTTQTAALETPGGSVTLSQTQPADGGQSAEDQAVQLALSQKAQAAAAWKSQSQFSAAQVEQAREFFQVDPQDNLMVQMIRKMVQAVTGKQLRLRTLPDLEDFFPASSVLSGSVFNRDSNALSNALSGAGRNSVTLTNSRTYTETRALNYSAAGVVQTSDGRQISVNLNLKMSSKFVASSAAALHFSQPAQNMADPLVVNFDAPAAELRDTTFTFDLDNNGTEEQISSLAAGSGFLALDQNGNGTIDNGGELFGTQSGDGFSDLSAYDEDGNGWIDENDDVYSKLRIWTEDSDGNARLFALGEKGIGAICLTHSAGNFEIANAENQVNGVVRSTGFFLRENGTAGTVQHVDLTY